VAVIIVKDVARTFAGSDYFKLGDGKVCVAHLSIPGCNETTFFSYTPLPALTQWLALTGGLGALAFGLSAAGARARLRARHVYPGCRGAFDVSRGRQGGSFGGRGRGNSRERRPRIGPREAAAHAHATGNKQSTHARISLMF